MDDNKYWASFYSCFAIPAPRENDEDTFNVEEVLLGLTLLTGDEHEKKSRFVFDLITHRTKKEALEADDVHFFLRIFFLVACDYAPRFSNAIRKRSDNAYDLWQQNYPAVIDDLVRSYVSWKGKIGRFEFILKSGTATLKDIFRYEGLMKKLNDYIYQQEERRTNASFPDAFAN